VGLATGRSQEIEDSTFLSRETVTMDFPTESAAPPDSVRPVVGSSTQDEPEEAAKVNVPEMDGAMAEEFFLEIQNILKELNEDIFQLEKTPENLQRVNVIFRHFHSIKGNLIMTGFSALGSFVHSVESVLDRIRDKELEVNQEIIDVLLDAVKLLEEALTQIRKGRSYELRDQELLTALEKYRRQEIVDDKQAPEEVDGAFHLSPLGQLLLQAKIAQKANIFQSMIKFKPRFQDAYLVAYLILRRLALIADVIDTVPSLDRIERGLAGEEFKVMFATRHDLSQVNGFFKRQLTTHFNVTEFENLLME
ncbi:MAG: Hpt domain-containing protein, partial [Deltaproteobacteria bacterium]|nr:Hpt domain-containing protein [Deltaproteobacteria bacterium]